MSDREAFEKWWPSVGQTIGKVAAWEAWQAAQAQTLLEVIRDDSGCPTKALQHSGEPVVDGNTSDGYHTFNELYDFRKAYNAAFFNELHANNKCSVHKSWRHHDNELCFGGGWFIVVAVLHTGQISNHYEAKDWGLFAIPEAEKALVEFDGHTGKDVVERLNGHTPQPVVDVNQQLVVDKYEKLEPALESLVDLCNNLNIGTYDEVIAAEAALERLYLARKAMLSAGKENNNEVQKKAGRD